MRNIVKRSQSQTFLQDEISQRTPELAEQKLSYSFFFYNAFLCLTYRAVVVPSKWVYRQNRNIILLFSTDWDILLHYSICHDKLQMSGEMLFQFLPVCSKIRCTRPEVLSYCFSKLICANWPASPSLPVSVTLFSVPFNPVVHQTVPALRLRITSMTSQFLILMACLSWWPCLCIVAFASLCVR